jgi:hypothetical protein
VANWRRKAIVCPGIGRALRASAISKNAAIFRFMLLRLLLERQAPIDPAAVRGLLRNLQNEFVRRAGSAPQEPRPSAAHAKAQDLHRPLIRSA